ncbi:MAG: hypothetical protein NWS86_06170 [Flavobacteriales bacterium]|nr:hypothetical protein [Flavobacteriales bacterium]
MPSIKAKATVSSSQGGEVEVINAFSKKPKPIAQPTGILKQQGVRVKPNERFVVREELGKANHQQASPSQTPEEIAEEEARGPIVKIDKRLFQDAWKDYAEQVKQTHEASFYTLLTTNIPDLHENTIDLSLNNSTQPPLLERYRSELLGHLREKLQAPGLELKFRVLEAEEGDARPYSDKEKYEAMKEKNPALEKLRIALNLDLEF